MLKYLSSLKQTVRSSALSEFTIVTGNQSADMDSCCSALLTAYLETVVNNARMVPLIAVSRDDMRLRRDIEFVFKSLNINVDWLLFLEDVELSDASKLFLVDHNSPTVEGKVVSVIDHHELEDPSSTFEGVDPFVRMTSGSCCSVVVEYFRRNHVNRTPQAFAEDPTLASLAVAPILLDTNNLTKKVEEVDRNAIAFLKDFMIDSNMFSPFAQFAAIKRNKADLEGLSMRDLLRKDYKRWDAIGISSLPKLIEKLVKKGLQDLPNAMERFRDQEKLDIMVALASGTNKRTDEYERQLVYCGPSDFDLAAELPTLQLELKSELEGVKFYQQCNVSASRKQVAPELRKAWAMHSNNSEGKLASSRPSAGRT